jgi:hypothetical protein
MMESIKIHSLQPAHGSKALLTLRYEARNHLRFPHLITKSSDFMMSVIITTIFMIILSGCNSSLSVSDSQASKPTIDGLDRLSAKPGDVVTVTGTKLTDDIKVFVSGKPASFHRVDSKSGTIEIPADIDPGLLKVTFAAKNKTITSLPIMNTNSIEAMSTLTVPLENICDSFIVKNESGDLAKGKANCIKQQTLCKTEGERDCKTTADFPAVAVTHVASKVIAGKEVAGVSGEAACNANN